MSIAEFWYAFKVLTGAMKYVARSEVNPNLAAYAYWRLQRALNDAIYSYMESKPQEFR